MAHAPGQSPDDGPRAAICRGTGFVLVAAASLVVAAAAVWLPAWARRQAAWDQRDRLRAVAAANDKLIHYRCATAEAIRCDPVHTRLLLMAQQNYSTPGELVVPVEGAAADGAVSEFLQVPPPRRQSALLRFLAGRIDNPRARRGLLVVAGGLMVTAFVGFLPREPGGRSAKT